MLSRAALDDLGLALDADCELLPVAGEASGGRRALGRELLAERTAVSRGVLFDGSGLLVGGSLDALRGARASEWPPQIAADNVPSRAEVAGAV